MRLNCLPVLLLATSALAAAPSTSPSTTRNTLPHIEVDVKGRTIRMECEAVVPEMPLELLVCTTGTKEYESLLRSRAKPSHLHLAMLMINLKPGQPVRFVGGKNDRIPPRGPALSVTCEFEKDGKKVAVPAHRLMRDVKTHKEMRALKWVFSGSRHSDDGEYAADVAGHLITVVNFADSAVDVSEARSDKAEALEMEPNPATCPPQNTKVWLVIRPAG